MTASHAAVPDRTIRTMRSIGLAMAAAVSAFGGLSWYVHSQETVARAATPPLFYVWVAVATSLTAASLVVWRGRVVPLIERRNASTAAHASAAELQVGVITTWAMVEAAALFGVVVYFVEGMPLAGLLGVFMMWAALALTWPQSDWLRGPGPPGT